MGTQSGGSRVGCSCRLTMRLPYVTSLLVVLTIIPVIIADPDVFGDYFDDGMKLVDISQDAALRSCLSDGKTADKTKAAYDGCYGQGYDFDDLAKAGGDDDGLPDELEEKEGCFYKRWAGSLRTMLWMKQPLQQIWKDWKKRYKMDSSVMLGLVWPGVETLERGEGGRQVWRYRGKHRTGSWCLT